MNKILVVEDEPNMVKGLIDNLEFEGYKVDTATDGEAGLKKILAEQYHLILLDVMMPKMSGFDVCRKAREHGIKTPIILLTAKGEEIDKVLGLELGADDYVTKPFSLRELLARIKAVLRRTTLAEADNDKIKNVDLNIGKLKVNFSSYTASIKGKSVDITHKEFDVLKYLWENRNFTVSRDELLKDVWGQDVYTTTRTIDNFILKLRQKIEDDPNRPKIILTVHGTGYKLIG